MAVDYPLDFRCPISLEVMSDPVIVASGHTFDRTSIQRWIDSGHRTCPVTMLPLPPRSPLIPNYALRSLIDNFAGKHIGKVRFCPTSDPIQLISSLSFPAAAAELSALLRYAKESLPFRRVLADSGAPSILLRHAGSPESLELQDLSLRTLLQLSLDGDDVRVGLVADGAADHLARALEFGGPNAALAATTLTSLAVVEVNKCTIGAHPRVISALSALLVNGKGRERREATTALYVLCKFPDNRRRAVRAGAVPGLLCFISDDGSERAVQVLGLIAKCREGREAMSSAGEFIGVLARILREGTARGIEQALMVLNLVCCDSKKIVWGANEEGVKDICHLLVEKDNGKFGRNVLTLARNLEKGELVGFI